MTTYHDATNLIALLHSSDIQTVRETESYLREHLQIGKDCSGLIYALVDDYIATQDECTLSLLELVEDPLDKDLSDRLTEHLKADASRVPAANLLGRLIQRQPLWLPSIFTSGLFQALLKLLLKTEPLADLPLTISGALLLCTLVPLAGSGLTSHLADICCLLVRMASAASKRAGGGSGGDSSQIAAPGLVGSNASDDLPLLHLHATVYALFNRLYAVFPNYLLDYLRSQLRKNGREFAPLFNSMFRDLLGRVRLHPLLVAGSKEAELQAQRWRRVTSADLLLECGRYCLDLVETTAGEAGIQLAATCSQSQIEQHRQQQRQSQSGEAPELLASSSEASRALGHSQSQQLQASSTSDAAAATAPAASDTDGQDEQLMLQQVLPEDGNFPSKDSFLCSSLVRRVRTRLYTHQPGSGADHGLLSDLADAGAPLSPLASASASKSGGRFWLRQFQLQQQHQLEHHQLDRQHHLQLPLPGLRSRSLSSPALLDLRQLVLQQQEQQQQTQVHLIDKDSNKNTVPGATANRASSSKSNAKDESSDQISKAGRSPNRTGRCLQLQPPPEVIGRDSQSYAELFLSALPMFPLAKCPECGHVSAGPHLYCQPAATCCQPLPQCLSLAPSDLMDAAVICSAELHRLFLEQRLEQQQAASTGVKQQQQQQQNHPVQRVPQASIAEQQLRAQLLQSRCLLMYERHRRELHAQRNRRLLARLVRLRSLEAEAEDARRYGRSKILQRVDELESCLLNERAEWQRERAELINDAQAARRLADERARELVAAREEARSASQLGQELRRLLGEERNQRMRAQARLEDAELELLASKDDCQSADSAGRHLLEAQRRLLVLGDLLARSETNLRQREAQLDELRFLRVHTNRLETHSVAMEAELEEQRQLLSSLMSEEVTRPQPSQSAACYAQIADSAPELAQLRQENAELKRRLAARDLDADLLAVSRIAGPAASDCSCCPLVRMTNSMGCGAASPVNFG